MRAMHDHVQREKVRVPNKRARFDRLLRGTRKNSNCRRREQDHVGALWQTKPRLADRSREEFQRFQGRTRAVFCQVRARR